MHSIIKSKPNLLTEASSSLGVAPYGEAEQSMSLSGVLKMLCTYKRNMAEDELSMDNDSDVLYELRIPEERVAVLIGKDGDAKKLIETQSGCRLNITKDGLVAITCEDGLKLYTAREIVKAVGRGFNPKVALLLLKTDYALDLIDLSIVTRSKNDMERIKGRIIGKAGKSREELERLTDTYITIYGKTIGIIGEQNQVIIARQGIAKLIDGAMHSTVYKFLEKKKRDMLLGM